MSGRLLKLTLDWAVVGDEPVAMADRPAVKAIQAESDPRQALMLWVQNVVEVAARIAPIGEVLTAAADVDPAAAELLAEASRNRPALMDGHLYRLLVAQRGWTAAEFTRWLSESLAAALLRT